MILHVTLFEEASVSLLFIVYIITCTVKGKLYLLVPQFMIAIDKTKPKANSIIFLI